MNTEAIETIEGEAGLTAGIYQDEGLDSPRTWNNLGTMICFHDRYDLGDKHSLKSEDFDGWAGLEGYLRKEEKAIIVLPLYLYDHGGLHIKVGSFRGLLPQGHAEFDSGQIGFIYTTRKAVLENFGGKHLTRARLKHAEAILEGEVETYEQYLSGDVYGYVVEDEAGEHIDSCWGYYGMDEARQAAQSALESGAGHNIINTEK